MINASNHMNSVFSTLTYPCSNVLVFSPGTTQQSSYNPNYHLSKKHRSPKMVVEQREAAAAALPPEEGEAVEAEELP